MFNLNLIQLIFKFFVNAIERFSKNKNTKAITTNTFCTFEMIVYNNIYFVEKKIMITKCCCDDILNENNLNTKTIFGFRERHNLKNNQRLYAHYINIKKLIYKKINVTSLLIVELIIEI